VTWLAHTGNIDPVQGGAIIDASYFVPMAMETSRQFLGHFMTQPQRYPTTSLAQPGELAFNGCSFTADTLVFTEDGARSISEVREGEYILAYNEETGETDYYPVLAVWAHEDEDILYLTIDGEVIITTVDHPFYTDDREWVAAGDLSVSDKIVSVDGSLGTVQDVASDTDLLLMYNFTVGEAHTYFIGESGWLVHNDCPMGAARAEFDWDHIFEYHSDWGREAQARKAAIATGQSTYDDYSFFEGLTEKQITARVAAAWRNDPSRIRTVMNPAPNGSIGFHEKILYEAVDPVSNQTIRFWYNKTLNMVETAFPVYP
jgi:hypothetical protein